MSDESAELFTQLVLEVFRLNGALLEAGDRLTGPVGLSSARWQVLGVVEHGPSPVAHVARTMGLTRQSVQQTADALNKDGFIRYVDNPHHRRAKLMLLTEKGEAALEVVRLGQEAWASAVASRLEPEALRSTLEGLRQVRQSLVAEESAQTP